MFAFTEAQEMFRREVRNFAERELMPTAKELAKQESVPRGMVKKLAEAKLLGMGAPEEHGGQGADSISLGIAAEELARAHPFYSLTMLLGGNVYFWLQTLPEKVRQEWLPGLMGGEKLCTWALTEPGCGSDAAAIKTRAVRDGEYYILNGEKTPISLGTEADVAMVCTKTDPEGGARGVTNFWVPLNLPGITRSHIVHTGWKPMAAASIVFEDVRVPSQLRMGKEGEGFLISMMTADMGRLMLSLMGLGSAQISLEETIAYTQQRVAFGQPIAKFEGISFKIAEHATLIEAARLLCYRTLSLRDQGLRHTKESAMCKWWCPQVAFNAIHDCILIHGHIGYSKEYPLEQRLRDTLGLEFTDGSAEIMKIIIGRELMGRIAVPY